MNKVTSQTQGLTKVNSLQASGILQCKCACGNKTIAGGECEACGKKRLNLQRPAVDSRSEHAEVPPIVHDVLRSPGQPLDAETRAFMEPRFGHDFSGVRVHTDTRAAESARAVNALAYTVGRDMVFGAGQYAPGTASSQYLLAHELTHVRQQAGSFQAALALQIAAPDHQEQEAEQTARAIAKGQTADAALPATGYQLSRFSDTGHHVIEEAALAGAGFNPEQIRAVERGNIERDYSQIGGVGNLALLCKPQGFGGYEPREHFDVLVDI